MMKRGLLVAWFWFFGISVFAQEDPVLMRVNGKDILRSEFEYSYRHRTGNADAKLSPKEYAELFAQSKLKVEAAKLQDLIRLLCSENYRKRGEVSCSNLI